MVPTLMPLGRPGYPDEIAKAVVFLARWGNVGNLRHSDFSQCNL